MHHDIGISYRPTGILPHDFHLLDRVRERARDRERYQCAPRASAEAGESKSRHKGLLENAPSEHHEAGSFVNHHAGSVRYQRSAGILPPVLTAQTGSQV